MQIDIMYAHSIPNISGFASAKIPHGQLTISVKINTVFL